MGKKLANRTRKPSFDKAYADDYQQEMWKGRVRHVFATSYHYTPTVHRPSPFRDGGKLH